MAQRDHSGESYLIKETNFINTITIIIIIIIVIITIIIVCSCYCYFLVVLCPLLCIEYV